MRQGETEVFAAVVDSSVERTILIERIAVVVDDISDFLDGLEYDGDHTSATSGCFLIVWHWSMRSKKAVYRLFSAWTLNMDDFPPLPLRI